MGLWAERESYQYLYHEANSMQSFSAQSCVPAEWHCVHGLHGSHLWSTEGEGAAVS